MIRQSVTKIFNALEKNEDLKKTLNEVLDSLPKQVKTESFL